MRIISFLAFVCTFTSPLDAVQAKSASTSVGVMARSRGGGIVMTTKESVTSSLLLALNAGYLNGCALSGAVTASVKQPATAVTGAFTLSAINFAGGNKKAFQHASTMILSYALGSMIAGFFTPIPIANEVQPSVAPLMLLGGSLLMLAHNLAAQGKTKVPFYLIVLVTGMQNSMTSTHTANLCRTSHYSGITSDIGTFAGQVLAGNKTNLVKLKIFCLLGAAFWIGGAGAVYLQDKLDAPLLLSSGLYFALGLVVIFKK